MKFFSYILSAIKSLPAKGRKNGIKILSLGIGLAVSLVLLTKVCFEQTYDDFYDNADRIFYVSEKAIIGDRESDYTQTPGGIAPRLKEHYPQIEEATRWTYLTTDTRLIMADGSRKAKAEIVIMADSCFFKMLNRPCLAGNLTEALGIEGNALISSDVAMKLSDASNEIEAATDVLGKVFTLDDYEGRELTIAGVYQAYPANSSYRPDVVVSLSSISMMGQYDGRDLVAGNDRYKSFVRLADKNDMAAVNGKMEEFVNRYLPVEEWKANDFYLTFQIHPLLDLHNSDSSSRSMMLILTLVAIALLITSVLNYILIVLSASISRSREMALRKCLGSDALDMYSMMTAESLVHTIVACALAVVLVYASKGVVEDLAGTAVEDLFSGTPLVLAIMVVAVVFFVNAIVPAAMYNNVPVATVFRNFVSDKRIWKRGLLTVEFCAVSFLGVLLAIISIQYNKLTTADLGFDCEHTAAVTINNLNETQKKTLYSELRALADVADVSLCYQYPFSGYSGNNVSLPGQDAQLFNISDAYYQDGHWFDVMGVDIVKGQGFTEGMIYDEEVIIDTNFEEKLKVNTGWDDVIGHEICVTSHNENDKGCSVIVGVFKPVYQGFSADNIITGRPMCMFYLSPDMSCSMFYNLLIRYHELSPEAMERTRKVLEKVAPGKELEVLPLRNERLTEFTDTLNVRNTILIGGIVTLLIAIIGLIGYTIDEVKRRSKEIAVRRVNGALFSEIRCMFIADIMKTAVPSAAVGCALAGIVANRWQQQFIEQAGLPWWVFVVTFTLTIALVAFISDVYVRIVAGSNPAESLKTE